MTTYFRYIFACFLVFTSLSVTLSSCDSSDDTDPAPLAPEPGPGFLKTEIEADVAISVETADYDKLGYSDSPTHRGYLIQVKKPIMVTHVGGLFPKTGQYPFDVLEVASLVHQDTLFMNPLDVSVANEFTYTALENGFRLDPGKDYLIRYHSADHTSVMDAWFPENYLVDNQQDIYLINNDDIRLTHGYYSYSYEDPYVQVKEHGIYANYDRYLRGLPDFRYYILEE